MTRFMTRRPMGRIGNARSGNTLRPVEWIRSCQGPFGIADQPFGVVIVTPAEFEDFTRPTVVRIRGELWMYVGDVAFGTTFSVVYGITIVNPEEPPPDPLVQRRGNRWLWWGCKAMVQQGSPDLEDNVTSIRIPFDVKSMRKRLVDGSELQLVLKADVIGVNAAVSASTLVKE